MPNLIQVNYHTIVKWLDNLQNRARNIEQMPDLKNSINIRQCGGFILVFQFSFSLGPLHSCWNVHSHLQISMNFETRKICRNILWTSTYWIRTFNCQCQYQMNLFAGAFHKRKSFFFLWWAFFSKRKRILRLLLPVNRVKDFLPHRNWIICWCFNTETESKLNNKLAGDVSVHPNIIKKLSHEHCKLCTMVNSSIFVQEREWIPRHHETRVAKKKPKLHAHKFHGFSSWFHRHIEIMTLFIVLICISLTTAASAKNGNCRTEFGYQIWPRWKGSS